MFDGKVMGVPKLSDEERMEQEQMKRDVLGGTSAALQPMNMNHKIMGGTQMEKTEENLPSLGGAGDYQDRLDGLLGPGGAGKSSNEITSDILGGGLGGNKANTLMGGSSGSMNPQHKAESMLGLGGFAPNKKAKKGKHSSNPTDKILGSFSGGNPGDKVNSMLGGSGSSGFKNMQNVFGKQPAGNPTQKVNSMFATQPQKKSTKKQAQSNPFKNGYSTPVNVSGMLGFSGNPTNKVDKILGGNTQPKGKVQQDQFDINKVLGNFGGAKAGKQTQGFDTSTQIHKMMGNVPGGQAHKGKHPQHSQSVNVERFLPKLGSGTDKGKNLGEAWAVPNFQNPASVGFERSNQQVGLSMFGDYDGDGLANAVDCDPRDKTEQGFFEKVKNTFTKGRFANDDQVEREERSAAAVDKSLSSGAPGSAIEVEPEPTNEEKDDAYLVQLEHDDATKQLNTTDPYGNNVNNMPEDQNKGFNRVKNALSHQWSNLKTGAASVATQAKDDINYEITGRREMHRTGMDIQKTDLALAQQEQGFEIEYVNQMMAGKTPQMGLANKELKDDFQRQLLNTPPEGRKQLAMMYQNKLALARVEAQAKIQQADAYAEAGYTPDGDSLWGKGKTKTGKKGTRAARKAANSFSGDNTAYGNANGKGVMMQGMIGTSAGGLNQNAELLTGVNRGSGAVSQMNLNSIASIGNSQMNDFKMNQAAALGSGGGGNAGLSQMSALGGSVGQGGDFAYRVAESLGEDAAHKSGFVTQPGQPQARDGVDLPVHTPVQYAPQQTPQYAPQQAVQSQPVFVQPQTGAPQQGYGESPQADLREVYAQSNPNKPPLPDGRVWSPRSKKYVRYPRGEYDKGNAQ